MTPTPADLELAQTGLRDGETVVHVWRDWFGLYRTVTNSKQQYVSQEIGCRREWLNVEDPDTLSEEIARLAALVEEKR